MGVMVDIDENLSVEICHHAIVLHVAGATCDQSGEVGSIEVPRDALDSIENALRGIRNGDLG